MEGTFSADAEQLGAKISQGDATAFRRLYDMYIDRVAGFVFTLSKSQTATEEIVQECFIKLWTSRSHLKEVRHIESYIFSIARNSVIDYLRKLHRDTRLHELIIYSSSPREKDNQHRLHEQDLQRIINEALAQLSPEKRQIFFMSKVTGMSHDEIADALQLSKSTIKNHLSQSLKHLRDYLKSHPESNALVLLAFFLE